MKILITVFGILIYLSCFAQHPVPLYGVCEIELKGSDYEKTDNPVRDIELITYWKHETSKKQLKIYGFFDGNGNDSAEGDVFKLRFCPIKTGKWTLIKVESDDSKLDGQSDGLKIECYKSQNHGFWIPDVNSAGKRWYKRSDGSHQYIFGNTHYSFLSEYFKGQPSGGNIKNDVTENARYFKKIRFAITGDIYPHPTEKPFQDHEGVPTDDRSYCHRPNPKWFNKRVDIAVQTAFENDLIADIISFAGFTGCHFSF